MKFIDSYFVFFTLLLSTSITAQELEGKWVISGNKSFGGFPGIHLMEVSEDSLSHYNFDQFVTKTSYETEDNKLKIDTLAFAEFSFKNPNRLSIASPRLEKPVDYIRLVPTETNLSTEEIRKIKYDLVRGGKNFIIDFQDHADGKIMESYLKKVDDTFFLVIHRHGNPITAVPIEKITQEKMHLYGFMAGPNKLVASAVE
ncbi:hypothetical protein [Salegentibacter salarius]|uniref:Uncharacterized protein n=1 Tax=Salegentibacter salarius TaxID=435906 RepID=A0A2N0TTE6_9FLAO|nr:hypothetical protein [Salegentibacter salarius]OEY72347.1 hypothetical protein BHS39_13735 [Salegentibacter salarius]PKD18004.1 hypothetical protein APR40_13700 [Salegentibacter salarius]SLK04240.1 hypothetical protein SAMN05660445_02812 [Salegentibacter salarius]